MANENDRGSAPVDLVERLEETNALLAEWAACAAEDSAFLIARLEAMGYAVRGKSHDQVAEVLRRPPERA